MSEPIYQPPLTTRPPMVRPWAVSAPILILLLCLPLLRPLRHPAELPLEESRLVKMVEQNLAGRLYVADSPPMSLQSLTEPSPTFALVLTAPAWVMQKMGFDFDNNATLMAFMLIAVGVTLPVALSASLIYRMGRLFELNRPKRAALGVICVTASGLVSYATTLSAHALSAALLIGAAACVLQTLRAPRARRGIGFTFAAGVLAMLAAALDPSALPVAVLLPITFLAWRVGWKFRLLAIALFIAGTIPPVALHRSLHGRPTPGPLAELASQPAITVTDDISGNVESGVFPWVAYHAQRLITATLGEHGLLSHFPLIGLGALGVMLMMHRNWPESVKWLAATTLAGGVIGVLAIVVSRIDFYEAAFATRWFIAFSPLLLFWSGAWLRRPHRKLSWALATLAAVFSITTAVIGAARPQPPNGFNGYTAAGALDQILHPANAAVVVRR